MLSALLTAPAPTAAQFVLLGVYIAVLWLPGIALGALVGLRGWALVALGPLLTYGLVTFCAPWIWRLGIPWNPSTAGLLLLGVLVVAAILRWPLRRWTKASARDPGYEPEPAWTVGGHAAVGIAVLAAGLFGATVLLAAFGGLSTINQDWDMMLHANGIRYIAETGAAGVYQMYEVNVYAGNGQVYYPNSYHLLGAVVFELSDLSIPEVLNAQTVLIPLMLALGLAAWVRTFQGRVGLAICAALVSPMATAVPYDVLWRGPLLPFVVGLVLAFAALAALRLYLDRPSVLYAIPLILSGAGMLGLHPSMLFTVALFAAPLLVQRWWRRWRRSALEIALLAAPAVCGAILAAPHIAGSLSAADSIAGFTWPQDRTPAYALGEVIGFSTSSVYPQVWLFLPFLVGVIGYRSLGQLRWVMFSCGIFAVLYILSAAYDTPWAHAVTSIWWNDKWRLAAIATSVFLPIAAHGLIRTHDVVLERAVLPVVRSLGKSRDMRPAWAATATLALLLGSFFYLTDNGYAQRNIDRTSRSYHLGSTVGAAELEAFEVLERLVQPDERVMNDRFDGSGWMYALNGVRPVAAHFNNGSTGTAVRLLEMEFDGYDTSPAVRAAVARLNVKWVMVGPGFIRSWKERLPGLDDLEQVDALHLVYHENGVRIYKLGLVGAVNPSGAPLTAPAAGVDG